MSEMNEPTFIHLLRKMGHDMRVPLNTLISTSDMLAEGLYDPLTAKQTKAVARLQRNNRRLLAMLDDFMVYVKAHTLSLELILQPFDPRTLLAERVDQVRSVAQEKGLDLQLSISDSIPSMLKGDKDVVSRIVVALLWNAVSFTSQGHIRVTSKWKPSSEWVISIQDSGPGIPEKDLPHIFEPFWRGEERPQVPTAGAGLGLPLALALAKLMSGSLVLRDTGAHGTTFDVFLPLEEHF